VRRTRLDPEEWSFEQRAALLDHIEQQLDETLDRIGRLSRDLAVETALVDYLKGRVKQYTLDDDPF